MVRALRAIAVMVLLAPAAVAQGNQPGGNYSIREVTLSGTRRLQ